MFAQMAIPIYYTIIIPGLPWITVRRLFVFALVLFIAISISGSRDVRHRIGSVLLVNRSIFGLLSAYFAMCVLFYFSSASPFESISHLTEIAIACDIPAIACIIVIRQTDDVRQLFMFISIISLLVTALGVIDFFGKANYAVEVLPNFIVLQRRKKIPDFSDVVVTAQIRNGLFARSIFNVPLSYGEFAATALPIGLYFIFEGENHRFVRSGLLSLSPWLSAFLL